MSKTAFFIISFFLFISFFSFFPTSVYAQSQTCAQTVGKECWGGESVCHPDGKCANLYCNPSFSRCEEKITDTTQALSVPKNFKQGDTTGNSVELQWDRDPAAETYEITDSAGQRVANVQNTTANPNKTKVTLSEPGKTYFLTIRGCRVESGTQKCSANSASIEVKAASTKGKKNLGEGCVIQITGESQCSVGNCVYVPLKSVDGNGICLDRPGTDTVSLPAPELGETGIRATGVSLSITNPDRNAVSYEIFYQKDGDTKYTNVSKKENNFTIEGLQKSTKYTFHAYAKNNKGEASPNSQPLIITTSEANGKESGCCVTGYTYETDTKLCKSTKTQDTVPVNCSGDTPICDQTKNTCVKERDVPLPPCEVYAIYTFQPDPKDKEKTILVNTGQTPKITPGDPPPDFDKTKQYRCAMISTAIGSISTDPVQFIKRIFGLILSISGGIAVLLIIYSGYQLMISQGNPEKINGAKETLTSAIIGLVFIIFSLVILQIIGVDILKIPGFSRY